MSAIANGALQAVIRVQEALFPGRDGCINMALLDELIATLEAAIEDKSGKTLTRDQAIDLQALKIRADVLRDIRAVCD